VAKLKDMGWKKMGAQASCRKAAERKRKAEQQKKTSRS